MLKLSVALCTHNPRRDYLDRTLAGLQQQSLGKEHWEFLLVDNASEVGNVCETDARWHSQGRILKEAVPGLTHARLCAMAAARADILLFVDDDNVLDPDYLLNAVQIGEQWPQLGVWGGAIKPEFDETPAEWTVPYWKYLAIREVKCARWSNQDDTPDMVPYGAGLCMRRAVMEKYSMSVRSDPIRLALGRTGTSLASAEDVDIYCEALNMGFGAGLFPELRLLHLIPPRRMQPDYLLRLVESNQYCLSLLGYVRNPGAIHGRGSWLARIKKGILRFAQELRLLGKPAFERQFRLAWGRGMERAHRDAIKLVTKQDSPPSP